MAIVPLPAPPISPAHLRASPPCRPVTPCRQSIEKRPVQGPPDLGTRGAMARTSTLCAALVMALAASAGAAGSGSGSGRPVDRYVFKWDSIKAGPSFGSPYVGNGDIGVAYSAGTTGEQLLSLGKVDFWTSEGTNYFNHNAAPTLSLALPNGSYTASNISQILGEARVTAVARSSDNATEMTLSVVAGEAGTNAVLAAVTCTTASGAACPLALTLRDCCRNNGGFGLAMGGDTSGLYFRKENLHDATNAAHLGSCNPDDLLYNNERTFVVDAASKVLTMSNGSCPWVLDPSNPAQSPITTGDCASPQGQWTLDAGTIAWTGAPAGTKLCLNSGAKLGPCGTTWWTLNQTAGRTHGYLQLGNATGAGADAQRRAPPLGAPAAGPQCLMVVPDNTNNTIAAATVVLETATGAILKGSPATPVNASDPADGVRYSVSLKSGVAYTITTAVLTLRDLGCAGTRPETARCPQSIEAAATAHAQGLAQPGALAKAHAAQAAFWAGFWNASSVDLTAGAGAAALPNSTVVEQWYYGMQYSFGTNVRPGKVTPSLSGVLVTMDPVAWKDQFTLDYNLESNFWGAGSSNRLAFMGPYMASVTNPALVASMRQRAANPGVWNGRTGTHWPGDVGSTVAGTACYGGAGGDACDIAQDLGHTGAYNGTAWVSTAFPLGDGRPAPTDLGTRFIGGLLATPLIQYFEYSRDMAALRDRVYPFVRDNAEFYASFAVADPSRRGDAAAAPLMLPYTCAQEGCDCRDNTGWYWRWGKFVQIPLPNMTKETATRGIWDTRKGEHNAHADIAFASASFRKAAEYAGLLGVDPELRTKWLGLLGRMPAYPTQTLTWLRNDSAVIVGSQLSGRPILVEAEAGPTPAAAAAAAKAGNSTVVWPWCNVEYPISNFAAMWPTDEVGAMQTTDPALLAAAKTTVYGLNDYAGYTFAGSKTPFANTNGFGLSWPPAVRVSNQSDAVTLMSRFATAASHVAGRNGICSNHGGMLENMGAVVAINDMLMQSHGGFLRFFPVWDPAALGPASFTTLRGYGAFLASASISAQGVVSPIELTSEVGSPCLVDSPWPTLVVRQAGKAVPTTRQGALWSFSTTAGAAYVLSSS